ncbi:MAG: arabinan endo-1,5-alpha-L-arabinosidase [Firmicutes bacterium]|nr:arabinan endo-1,5-alpha-L-arabinosidase [Bacillota bacterium]
MPNEIIYPKAPPKQPPMPDFRRPPGPPPQHMPVKPEGGQQPPAAQQPHHMPVSPAPGNPPAGHHPPRPDMSARGLWGAHDPAIYRDPTTGDYFAYCTHQNVYRSPDLVSWRHIGNIIDETPEEVFAWTKSHGLWAPDIIKVGDEYRMYCSCSSFGVRESCIYLAVSDKAEGKYTYRGIVVKTNSNSPVNAIDANPVVDVRTGRHYMAFGSFWGGIRLIELDPETGLALDNTEAEDGRTADSALGVPLVVRPEWCDRAVEGAYIKYNPDTDYYYIFVSYGSLSNDYNIRVARSRDIKGPYLDFNGHSMTGDYDDIDEINVGFMPMAGYKFENSEGWMAPGHNSVLVDEDGSWYLVCHIRPYGVYRRIDSTMHIRRILWTESGYPVVSPENYAGEVIQSIPEDAIAGRYEWITLMPTMPQTVIGSAPAALMAGGDAHISSYTRCKWTMTGEHSIKLDLGHGHSAELEALAAWDAENDRPTIALTGVTDRGVAVWAKRMADLRERHLHAGAGGPTV